MSGGGRCPRHRQWSRRRHEGGAKICDDDDDGVERVVKPASVGIVSDAKDPICAPDRRIGRGRLRVNAEGILYVLDSEDEDDMDVDADGAGVATEGAATANGADLSVEGPPVADDGAASDDLPLGPPVSGDGAAGEVLPLGPPLVAAGEASEMDLAPEVAACLKEVLANMDPIYHEVFISMVFENPVGLDSDTTDRQTALLSASGHSSGNSSGSDDWIEPAAYVLNSTALLSREHRNVLDAFRLLQKDPTVQMGFIFIKLMFLEMNDFTFLLIGKFFIEIRCFVEIRLMEWMILWVLHLYEGVLHLYEGTSGGNRREITWAWFSLRAGSAGGKAGWFWLIQ